MNSLFRFSNKDTYLIIFTLVMLAVPVALAFSSLSITWLVLISAVHSFVMVVHQNSSLHHHTHWATFNNKTHNSIYECVLSAASGVPSQVWRIGHLIHHKYVNDVPDHTGHTKDPTSVYFGGKNGEVLNFWKYSFISGASAASYYLYKIPYYVLTLNQEKNIKREYWSFRIFIAVIALINFQYSVILLLAYLLSYAINQANSYGEHWGYLHLSGDTTRDSYSNYGKWFNLLTFNAGYHQEHHHRPGTHWTKLPEVTPYLPNDRKVLHKHAVFNNPYWDHFKLLFKR